MSLLNILEEQAAQALTSILDGLRARHHFALVCEGHAGHAKTGEGSRGVRPIGASLFLRWPEFGWGIRADEEHRGEEHPSVVDVISWRGGRDERDWPTGLQHGHELPWSPTADYWDRVARPTGRT
jgi:replicative DNA helicase